MKNNDNKKYYVNGHSNYLEYSQTEIINRINDISSNAPTSIYIHGPFCINLCNFCQHQGVELKNNLNILEKYYKEYLPHHLREYGEVITNQQVESVYFGGGTADLIPEYLMKPLFESIPMFDSIPCKIFECHPASLTKNQIDILHNYNFSSGYISFGIQTFDKNVTDRENRIYVSPKKILKKLEYIYSKNIFVNIDLVAYLNNQDLNLLEEDLNTILSNGEPSIITIYPLRQAFNYLNQKTQEQTPETIEIKNNLDISNNKKFQEIESLIERITIKYPKYHQWVSDKNRKDFFKDIKTNRGKPYYLTNQLDSLIDQKRIYNSSTQPFHNKQKKHLVLGIITEYIHTVILKIN